MRIIVIGGTGGGGRAVVAALRAAGHEVWSAARGQYQGGPTPDIACDRMDPALAVHLERVAPEIVVDHVGYAPREVEQLLAILPSSARRLIYISSAVVYGGGRDVPYHEGEATRPLGPFAEAKREAERRALEGPEAVSLRLGALYGPGHAPLTPWGRDAGLLDRLQGGEVMGIPALDRPSIQPLYSGDLGRVVAQLVEHPDPPPILNVVGEERLSWRALFEAWAAAIGAPRPEVKAVAPEALDVPARVRPFLSALLNPPLLDGGLLAQTLGAPSTPVAEGFAAVYNEMASTKSP